MSVCLSVSFRTQFSRTLAFVDRVCSFLFFLFSSGLIFSAVVGNRVFIMLCYAMLRYILCCTVRSCSALYCTVLLMFFLCTIRIKSSRYALSRCDINVYSFW
jgi:hypothetical protein